MVFFDFIYKQRFCKSYYKYEDVAILWLQFNFFLFLLVSNEQTWNSFKESNIYNPVWFTHLILWRQHSAATTTDDGSSSSWLNDDFVPWWQLHGMVHVMFSLFLASNTSIDHELWTSFVIQRIRSFTLSLSLFSHIPFSPRTQTPYKQYWKKLFTCNSVGLEIRYVKCHTECMMLHWAPIVKSTQ